MLIPHCNGYAYNSVRLCQFMVWDASFKNFLKRFIEADISTEIDVPTANLRLDFLIKKKGKLPFPFSYTKGTILGEFKSERDKFSIDDIYKGLAKAYLHIGSSKSENVTDVTLMFIIGEKPLPSKLPVYFDLNPIEKGVTVLQHQVHTIVVELDKIEYDEENMFLGIFASKPIRKRIIAKALQERESFIISYSYFLYKDEVVEVAKAENIEVDPRALSIRSAVESIGIDRIIEEFGIEKTLSQLTPEQKDKILKILSQERK